MKETQQAGTNTVDKQKRYTALPLHITVPVLDKERTMEATGSI
jgi:hypothetical protein